MLLFWYLSVFISALTFVYGVSQKSAFGFFMSAVTFLPISIYFAGMNHPIQYIALTPVAIVMLGIYLIASKKKIQAFN